MLFFFFNDTAPTEIYTLSLHDALPISPAASPVLTQPPKTFQCGEMWGSVGIFLARAAFLLGSILPPLPHASLFADRKSTRLNSSHANISYAVFCLKKKNTRP